MTLAIKRFFTEFLPAADGGVTGRDKVEYGHVGQLDRTTTTRTIHDVNRAADIGGSTNNQAVVRANEVKDYIMPRYEAWKKGQELPEEGTPLGAWNAIRPEQADLFRTKGVKTVEEIAAMTDSQIGAFPLPGMREIVRQAKFFLESSDQRLVSAKLSQKDEEVTALQEELADMKAQMQELMQAAREATVEKRKPGRPPKSDDQAAA